MIRAALAATALFVAALVVTTAGRSAPWNAGPGEIFTPAVAPGFTNFLVWTDYGAHVNTASRLVWTDYGAHVE